MVACVHNGASKIVCSIHVLLVVSLQFTVIQKEGVKWKCVDINVQ